MENNINDKRGPKDFKGITFSKYKKSDVKKELLKSFNDNKIESACYWAAEYVAAGHFGELWDIFLEFMAKNIYLANPKLPLYMDMRFESFKQILEGGYMSNELRLRNNDKIRKLFSEICCILCLSHKKNKFSPIKVTKSEYIITDIQHRLKAPKLTFGTRFFLKDDPKELFIAVNEFAYHLSKRSKNANCALFWFEWMLGFESICKKEKKNNYKAARRNMPVSSKNQNDIIWIIWEIILFESSQHKCSKIIKSLLNNFCIKYTSGASRKRRYIIYFAVHLIVEKYDIEIKICKNNSIVEKVTKKINMIYKQIKKNEVSPNTDYLFKGLNDGNLEKTIAKLDVMDKIGTFIPRNN